MAIEKSGALKRARGRPRNFDRSIALHQAMKLFWERGYVGTSFDDLIAAMGINPSSFYNSFGNKERLYQEATEAYMARSSEWFAAELGASTDARTAFHRLLNAAARELTQDDLPTGCMISLAGTHVPPALTSLRDMMAGYRRAGQAAMADRIRRGIDEGDVPEDTNVDAISAFYSALLRGMAVQARDGASRERLLEIARRHRLRPDLHTGFLHSRAADRPPPRSSRDRSPPAREEPPRLGSCNGGGAFASGH